MSTSPTYIDCDHIWDECGIHNGDGCAWYCRNCGCETAIAPWSYSELIGVIGLEALYQGNTAMCLKTGLPIPSKEKWADSPIALLLNGPDLIKAMQAGCRIVPMPIQVPRPPMRRMLVS